MKLVEVHWLDSASFLSPWSAREDVEAMRPAECRSVGYVVSDAKAHLTIASHLAADAMAGDLTIPRACITKIKALK